MRLLDENELALIVQEVLVAAAHGCNEKASSVLAGGHKQQVAVAVSVRELRNPQRQQNLKHFLNRQN